MSGDVLSSQGRCRSKKRKHSRGPRGGAAPHKLRCFPKCRAEAAHALPTLSLQRCLYDDNGVADSDDDDDYDADDDGDLGGKMNGDGSFSEARCGGKRRKHSWGPRGKTAPLELRCFPTVAKQQQPGSAGAARIFQKSSRLRSNEIRESECLESGSAAQRLAALLGQGSSIDQEKKAFSDFQKCANASEASLPSLQCRAEAAHALPISSLQRRSWGDDANGDDDDVVVIGVCLPLTKENLVHAPPPISLEQSLWQEEGCPQTGSVEAQAIQLQQHEEYEGMMLMMEADVQAIDCEHVGHTSGKCSAEVSKPLHWEQQRQQHGSDLTLATKLQMHEDFEAMKIVMGADVEACERSSFQRPSGTRNASLHEALLVESAERIAWSKSSLRVQLETGELQRKQVLSDEALALQLQRREETLAEKERLANENLCRLMYFGQSPWSNCYHH